MGLQESSGLAAKSEGFTSRRVQWSCTMLMEETRGRGGEEGGGGGGEGDGDIHNYSDNPYPQVCITTMMFI